MTLIAEASSGEQAIKLFRQHHPDVILMDLRLPGMSGIDAMIAIRGEFPEARIIILSTFEGDAEVQRALKAGARAYILKTMPPEEMVQTIRHVYAGKVHVPPEVATNLAGHYAEDSLTAREVEVLQHVANGQKNRDIADKLCISEHTVKAHLKSILRETRRERPHRCRCDRVTSRVYSTLTTRCFAKGMPPTSSQADEASPLVDNVSSDP